MPKQAIHVIQNLEQCEAIRAELEQVSIFGFDSESKPTFQVGEVSTGPHLIQLASIEHAYLFQMSPPIWNFLAPFLANPDQLKVGFGLKNDAHLFRKKGFELKGVVELSKCFASFGLTNPVGIKNAIALLFQLNFPKSKKSANSLTFCIVRKSGLDHFRFFLKKSIVLPQAKSAAALSYLGVEWL